MKHSLAFGIITVLIAMSVGCGLNPLAAPPVDTTQVLLPKSYKFSPTVIRVKPGTTVTWQNDDNFIHSVFVSALGTAPQTMQPGESAKITFDQPGEYTYICIHHPNDMKGEVIVTSAESAPTPSTGY
jgi:plastocyanin